MKIDLILKRPLAIYDLEATGTEPATDRIVSIAIRKRFPNKEPEDFYSLINPMRPIPPESTEIHGIRDEDVEDAPKFYELAPMLAGFLKDCDLAGYGIRRFDLPMLDEEFARVNVPWEGEGRLVLDAAVIFMRKEPRDLSAALKKFCGREHDGAHDATADVLATDQVIHGQFAAYPEIAAMTLAEMSAYSCREDEGGQPLDFAGKFVRKNGTIRYNLGKDRGKPVDFDGYGLCKWLLGKDFTQNTKKIARQIINGELI